MRGLTLYYRQLLFAVVCLALSVLAMPVTARAESANLQPCVAKVRSGDTLTSVMWQANRFDCNADQTALEGGSYWVRMAVPEAMGTQDRSHVFRSVSTRDDGFELWAIYADGQIAHYRPFENPQLKPMRLGGTVVVPIKSYPEAVSTLIARVHNSQALRGVMLQPVLASNDSAIAYEMAMAALYSGFMGLCLALLVYNASLWHGMRHPFLLAYCAMLVCAMLYAFMTSGAIHYFVDSLSGADRIRITTPLLALTAASGMIFIRHFFEESSVPNWLKRITYAQIVAMCTAAIVYTVVAPYHAKLVDSIYTMTFIPLPAIFLCYLWNGWRNRDPFLGYFVLAWSGPAVSVILRMLFSLDILPHHPLIENSTLMGLAFEALVSSLAIGHRVRIIAQARDNAQLAEVHALAMADTDPLTGLLNRRAFLRKLIERQSQWTLVLIDIDHFKRVNDALGHDGGDEVIVRFAQALGDHAPGGALAARLGGEEFALAWRGDLMLVEADDLLKNIRQIKLPQGYRTTASIGIAARVVANEDDWKILYRAADMALYKAKANGRDCYVHIKPMAQAAA
jgi:diguanylate cyclase (GGDEF)-like protein